MCEYVNAHPSPPSLVTPFCPFPIVSLAPSSLLSLNAHPSPPSLVTFSPFLPLSHRFPRPFFPPVFPSLLSHYPSLPDR